MAEPSATESSRDSSSDCHPTRLPELLSPAGDWNCARAAVENGADAIYFALEKFNARVRANNFTAADMPALMEYLHRRRIRGYACLNTLVFENELAEAEADLRAMIAAGVDAVLVQDVGIARLVRRLSPDFPMHASTQMTITSTAGVEFARELGCDLVVLARECSLKDIEAIQASQRSGVPMPLETFVHGALCVAYSGQCLTSEALGGRSANRGECAQACRLPYELIADGQPVPLGDRRYLLSPQDLAGLELLPVLVGAGLASLKIEGRLKTPEYVANITRIYRQALDELRPPNEESRPANLATRGLETANRRYEMEMAFSRGLCTGWLRGINNQELVHGRFGKKRGVFLGEIAQVLSEAVVVRLEGPLKPGDGVVFDAGRPDEEEQGGRVYEVRTPKTKGRARASEARVADWAELRFGRGDVDFSRVHLGDKVWKTSDPALERRLRQSFTSDTPQFQRPMDMEICGSPGEPLTLIVRDELGDVVKIKSTMPLVPAKKQPLTTGRLCQQLGRLGGTPFRLGKLKNTLAGEVLLPISELNRLRREAVAELERRRAKPRKWQLASGEVYPQTVNPVDKASAVTGAAVTATQLIALVRTLPQLEAALECGITTVYCDFEDPKRYREAVTLFHTARGCAGNRPSLFHAQPSIWVAPPRVFKPGEDWILRQVRSCNADGYLIRNYDHLRFFAGERCVGDYSLNIANALAADYFKSRFGLERVTASYDLNFSQLEALLAGVPPEWFEVTIHQRIPMFHMEHCVFCAFLSSGTDYTNCGRPCDRRTVQLRDRVGAAHPVKADAGCRNTVFNARAQTGAEYVERMLKLGVRHFRVEFLNDSPAQMKQTLTRYRQLLRGEITGAQVWRELKLMNQLGVTRGTVAV